MLPGILGTSQQVAGSNLELTIFAALVMVLTCTKISDAYPARDSWCFQYLRVGRRVTTSDRPSIASLSLAGGASRPLDYAVTAVDGYKGHTRHEANQPSLAIRRSGYPFRRGRR